MTFYEIWQKINEETGYQSYVPLGNTGFGPINTAGVVSNTSGSNFIRKAYGDHDEPQNPVISTLEPYTSQLKKSVITDIGQLKLPNTEKKGTIKYIANNENPILVHLDDGTKLYLTVDSYRRIKPKVGQTMVIKFQRRNDDSSNEPSRIQDISIQETKINDPKNFSNFEEIDVQSLDLEVIIDVKIIIYGLELVLKETNLAIKNHIRELINILYKYLYALEIRNIEEMHKIEDEMLALDNNYENLGNMNGVSLLQMIYHYLTDGVESLETVMELVCETIAEEERKFYILKMGYGWESYTAKYDNTYEETYRKLLNYANYLLTAPVEQGVPDKYFAELHRTNQKPVETWTVKDIDQLLVILNDVGILENLIERLSQYMKTQDYNQIYNNLLQNYADRILVKNWLSQLLISENR